MQDMTLKDVCSMVGVTRRVIQGYEQAGIVTPSGKNKYGYLLYDDETIKKIKQIKQYQDFGFTVKEIKVLLVASEEDYVNMMTDRLEMMKKQLRVLTKNIKQLKKMIEKKEK